MTVKLPSLSERQLYEFAEKEWNKTLSCVNSLVCLKMTAKSFSRDFLCIITNFLSYWLFRNYIFFAYGNDISDNTLKRVCFTIWPQNVIQDNELNYSIYYRTFVDKIGGFRYGVGDNNHGRCFL